MTDSLQNLSAELRRQIEGFTPTVEVKNNGGSNDFDELINTAYRMLATSGAMKIGYTRKFTQMICSTEWIPPPQVYK